MRISVILRNIDDTPSKKKLFNMKLEDLKNKIKSITDSSQFLKLKSSTGKVTKAIMESPQVSTATDKILKTITEAPQVANKVAKAIMESPQVSIAKDKVVKTITEAPQVASKVAKTITRTPQVTKLNSLAINKKQALYKRVLNVNNWYIKAIGLEEVKLFHDRVLNLQEQLMNTQGKRREIGRQLNEVRQRAMELQAQLQNVNKHENFDQYFALMKQEGDLVKLEKSIYSDFQEYDQTERELFTAFTNAIRDSYEKQRAQVEYTKYFGLILGIIASFLTFVYSTIKKYDLKSFIEDKLSKLHPMDTSIYHEVLNANRAIKQDLVHYKEYLSSNKALLERMQYTNNLIIKEQKTFRDKLNDVIAKMNVQSKQQPLGKPKEIHVVPEGIFWLIGGLALFAFILGKAS